MNLKLYQVLIEDKYNRKSLRAKVAIDIVGSNFGHKFKVAQNNVANYLAGNYYESKSNRVSMIAHMDVDELIHETLIAVALSEEPQPIQAVASRLGNHLPFNDPFDAIKTASELIAVICHSDLYDIIPAKHSDTGSLMVKANFSLELETLKAINTAKYLPPMVCKPNYIQRDNNRDTSHLTFSDSLILGKQNHYSEFTSIDAINIANRVELALDEDMLMFEETPNKPLDTPEKVKQFNKLIEDSLDVYNEILSTGNSFYLTWKFDFRGRQYSQGYHVNIQSTGYKKSLINLAKKEVITL